MPLGKNMLQEIKISAPQLAERTIALWAVPRSTSTAFEKAISQNESISVLHEPFANCYYFGKKRKSSRYGDQSLPSEPDELKIMKDILTPKGRPTFFKDLAFQAAPFITDEFLSSIENSFIIRHPENVVRSLHPIKPDFTVDELGVSSNLRFVQ